MTVLICLKSPISLWYVFLHTWSWSHLFCVCHTSQMPTDARRWHQIPWHRSWQAVVSCLAWVWEQYVGPLEEHSPTLGNRIISAADPNFHISRQPGSVGTAWSWVSKSGWLLSFETGFHVVQASLKLHQWLWTSSSSVSIPWMLELHTGSPAHPVLWDARMEPSSCILSKHSTELHPQTWISYI